MTDWIKRLDPEIAAWVATLAPGDVSASVMHIVRELPSPLPERHEEVLRTDHVVQGDALVPVRVHRPRALEGPAPCIVSIHGGGYIAGSYNDDAQWLDPMCLALGVVGLSVDYRLAPETTYPGALDDCYAALRWVYENAEELGVDRNRIGVFGASAGGGLAASVALKARDRGDVAVAFLLLLSPMLDDRQITTSSHWDGLPVWSRESNAFGWRSYLGDLYGTDAVPYTAAPARALDLEGLPPTYISVGSFDGFVDEDVDFAVRLNWAGVLTELHVYPGGCHGFEGAATALSRQSREDVARWLQKRVGRGAS